MKHTLGSLAVLLVLTSCAETGGQRAHAQADYHLVPAHQAAAAARRSPGFVATPAPKFSGAGTVPATYDKFPDSKGRNRRSGGYYYGNPYYGNPYFGNPYPNPYRRW